MTLERAGRRVAAGGATVLFSLLVLPVAVIFLNLTPSAFREGLRSSLAAEALTLSMVSTGIALIVLILAGTPLAYWLAVREFPGKRWVETLVDLPVAIPPAVVGVGLIMALGRHGLVGRWLAGWDVTLAFTLAAVVMAQMIVAAPHYIRTAQQAFAGVDPCLPLMARSLGASPAAAFRRVMLPLAGRGLLTGAALAWARALGEFGATIVFAGNMPGRTQTMPLAVYTAMESDLNAALALSALLAGVGFAVLAGVKFLAGRAADG